MGCVDFRSSSDVIPLFWFWSTFSGPREFVPPLISTTNNCLWLVRLCYCNATMWWCVYYGWNLLFSFPCAGKSCFSSRSCRYLLILTWQPGKIHIDGNFIRTSPTEAVQGTSRYSNVQWQQCNSRQNNQGIISCMAHHCDVTVFE